MTGAGKQLGAAAAIIALTLGGCAGAPPPVTPVAPDADSALERRSDDWRSVATDRDRARLRGWRASFVAGLEQARRDGFGAEVASQRVLLEPDAALPNPHIPPGDYECRVIKLGSTNAGGLSYVAYPAFRCRVEAEQGVFSLMKLSGSQRHNGLLFADTEWRKVFLGTLALGDETGAMEYGMDAQRDVAGTLERIGPARWRLVMPAPAYESLTDVMELVPVQP